MALGCLVTLLTQVWNWEGEGGVQNIPQCWCNLLCRVLLLHHCAVASVSSDLNSRFLLFGFSSEQLFCVLCNFWEDMNQCPLTPDREPVATKRDGPVDI